MPDGAKEYWRRLRATDAGDGKLEVPSLSTGVDTGYGPALYAVGPNGEPRLLVPFAPGSVTKDLGSGPNLFAGVSNFQIDGHSVSFLDVMVADRKLDQVFAELVGEILVRLREGLSPPKAVSGTISDFRTLLHGQVRKDVSFNELMGVVGELLVVKRLVDLKPEAVASWTGPFGQRHDFRREDKSLEVKTSGRTDATRLAINGFHQLHPPEGGMLHLVHVRLERAAAGDLSVSKLCSSILEAGADRETLMSALNRIGCDDPFIDQWNHTQFSFEGLDIYRVEAGFPRLTPKQFVQGKLPEGVVAVSYEIDLSHARTFLVPHDVAPKILKGFVE